MTQKDQIIAELSEARKKILGTVALLHPAQQDEIFLGTWSVKDLLAHLAGWDYTNIQAVKEIRAGKNPSCFTHWNPNWAAYNARLVKEYKNDDWVRLLAVLARSHRALMDFLRALPAEDFERDFGVRSPRGRNITVAYHLQAEIDDEKEHDAQIMKLHRRGKTS